MFGCPLTPCCREGGPAGAASGDPGEQEPGPEEPLAHPPGPSRGRSPPRCLFSFSSVIKSFLKA